MLHNVILGALGATFLLFAPNPEAQSRLASPGTFEGSSGATVWHVTDLSFQHDTVLFEGGTPNPFFDFRLDVTFQHVDSGTVRVVPGFFDADGQAADSGFSSGDRWRVRFVPDLPGQWDWAASFRAGIGVAVDDDALAGAPASFDGTSGSFVAAPADPAAPGLRSKGLLEYTGERLMRFAWTNEAFLKAGADSPENLLGYWEFDGTTDNGGDPNDLDAIDGLHRYAPHVADFDAFGGGPTWKGGLGQGLLGALNYLSSVGVNSVYFLTYNIDGGDGGEVYPFASTTSKLRYDVSKLAQWERVFDHMTDRGLVLHVVLQEEENDQALDFGDLGDQRRLYYREMVARFACNLGLVWNLGEETTNTDEQRMDFATYIRALDPWDHPIAVHTKPDNLNAIYGALLGFPAVELCSLQTDPEDVRARTLEWTTASSDAGRAWIVTSDEQNPAEDGAVPDAADPKHDVIRREALWGNLLAGGGGAEFYFGYAWPDSDLDCEDFRSRSNLWDQARIARETLRDEVDHPAMRAADELTGGSLQYCLADPGEAYLVYTRVAVTPTLDLESSTDTFEVEWLDVLSGGPLRIGTTPTVSGPGVVSLGRPPAGVQDAVAFVRRVADRPPVVTAHSGVATKDQGLTTILLELHADDPDGRGDILLSGVFLVDPHGDSQGFYPFDYVGGDLYASYLPPSSTVCPGTWTYVGGVLDQAGRFDIVSGAFDAPE